MALDRLDNIKDSLIIEFPMKESSSSQLLLFIVATNSLNEKSKTEIKQHLKKQCSPRHAPDYIIPVKEIPYTISGKKMEIPVKKIFSGFSIDKVAAPGAMRNPESLNAFVEIRNKMSF